MGQSLAPSHTGLCPSRHSTCPAGGPAVPADRRAGRGCCLRLCDHRGRQGQALGRHSHSCVQAVGHAGRDAGVACVTGTTRAWRVSRARRGRGVCHGHRRGPGVCHGQRRGRGVCHGQRRGRGVCHGHCPRQRPPTLASGPLHTRGCVDRAAGGKAPARTSRPQEGAVAPPVTHRGRPGTVTMSTKPPSN